MEQIVNDLERYDANVSSMSHADIKNALTAHHAAWYDMLHDWPYHASILAHGESSAWRSIISNVQHIQARLHE